MIFSKERLLSNWHPMRMVRLAIGLYLVGAAVYMNDWMFGSMGVFFLYQSVTDTSCCGAAGCSTPRSSARLKPVEPKEPINVDYEEIK